MSGFDFSQEAANYCSNNEIEEVVVDNFKDSKKKLVNAIGDSNSDSFLFFAILYGTGFQLNEKTNRYEDEDELKNDTNKVDLSKLFLIKINWSWTSNNNVIRLIKFWTSAIFSESLRTKREIAITC